MENVPLAAGSNAYRRFLPKLVTIGPRVSLTRPCMAVAKVDSDLSTSESMRP
jgi:hypothetical protein